MVSYGIAMANRADWNERTEITKAVITWVDDEEFTEWVEKNSESLAKADAEENETIFEGIDRIDFKED